MYHSSIQWHHYVGGTSLINHPLFLKHIQLLQTTSGTHTPSLNLSMVIKENANFPGRIGPCLGMRSRLWKPWLFHVVLYQPMGFERVPRIQPGDRGRGHRNQLGGSNGSNADRSVSLSQAVFHSYGGIHSHGATPSSLDGFLMENPQLKLDDLGVPPWIGNLHISYNYLWLVDTVYTSSSEILSLLLKVTHFQVKLPNKQCSNPRPSHTDWSIN